MLLTPDEQIVLDYVRDHRSRFGYSPSIREIATKLNVRSTSTAHSIVGDLLGKDVLSRTNGIARSIVPVDD